MLIKWLKMTKGHNSGKKAVKRDLGIICTSSGHGNNNWKVSSKTLENCRRSCGDKVVSTDGRTDGRTEVRTDGRTHYYSPLRLTSGDKNEPIVYFETVTHYSQKLSS